LYPFVAIALGLKARGHSTLIATGECYRKRIEPLGIGFWPVLPDCDWVDDPDVMRRIMHPRWGLIRVFREVWQPVLREAYESMLAATKGADLIVAMQAEVPARLVAEKKGILWASAMHFPVGLYSAYDPPILPGFGSLSNRLRFLGPPFWKPLGYCIKWATRGVAKPIDDLREELGLPRDSVNPLTDGFAPLLHLALFSKLLSDKQRDWPSQTVVTGFPWFDQDGDSGLPDELTRFLDQGPSPIVFSLGTAIAQGAEAHRFFESSAAGAKLIGRRAILITNKTGNRPAVLPEGVVACDYARFTELFPRAAAVVHHGGIGTTALAMRSGRPMLVCPHAWDQPDNAGRVARLGISRTIPPSQYTPERVAAELHCLVEDPIYSKRSLEISEVLRKEDGVAASCDAIEALLQNVNAKQRD
jgi:UDP:flavonoid glycosyltransferase YjiC (YdhE family)